MTTKTKPKRCAGSGRLPKPNTESWGGPLWAKCTGCDLMQPLTKTGKVKVHKQWAD